tara:strand:- start:19745 stop:19930 length:186 start_codon:yes stop_codon:yes gene_type:complete
MEKNVGKTDKIIRVILVLILAYLGYAYSYWWFVLAALLLITVFTGFCWPYTLFKINTCKKE